MHLVILKIKFGLLLCPYSHTRRTTSNVATVFKAHKDPVRCRIKWHIAVALDKDPKGRCRVGVDRRRHSAANPGDTLTRGRIGLAETDSERQTS